MIVSFILKCHSGVFSDFFSRGHCSVSMCVCLLLDRAVNNRKAKWNSRPRGESSDSESAEISRDAQAEPTSEKSGWRHNHSSRNGQTKGSAGQGETVSRTAGCGDLIGKVQFCLITVLG